MTRLAGVLDRLQQLERELGPEIWADPTLARARERHAVWTAQSVRLKEVGQAFGAGATEMCGAWARVALEDSDLRQEFGFAMTKELTRSPCPSLEMTQALSQAVPVLDGTFEERFPCILSNADRISRMLCTLRNAQLNTLLLMPEGRRISALHAAAKSADLTIFCAFLKVLGSDMFTVDANSSAIARPDILSDCLGVPLERLRLWHLPDGCLGLRVLPLAGEFVEFATSGACQWQALGMRREPWPQMQWCTRELGKLRASAGMVAMAFLRLAEVDILEARAQLRVKQQELDHASAEHASAVESAAYAAALAEAATRRIVRADKGLKEAGAAYREAQNLVENQSRALDDDADQRYEAAPATQFAARQAIGEWEVEVEAAAVAEPLVTAAGAVAQQALQEASAVVDAIATSAIAVASAIDDIMERGEALLAQWPVAIDADGATSLS